MIDTRYAPCQRCGCPQCGDFARTLLDSKRLVCDRCYCELEIGPDQKRIDDSVTRSWPETLALRSIRHESDT